MKDSIVYPKYRAIKLRYLLAASLHLILRFILITDPDQHQDPTLLRGRLSKWLCII